MTISHKLLAALSDGVATGVVAGCGETGGGKEHGGGAKGGAKGAGGKPTAVVVLPTGPETAAGDRL